MSYIDGEDDPLRFCMNRVFILSCLQAAEKHIASSEHVIVDQCNLIHRLERASDDTTSEVALFREMEQRQLEHLDDRDRLLAELRLVDAVEAARAQSTRTRKPVATVRNPLTPGSELS